MKIIEINENGIKFDNMDRLYCVYENEIFDKLFAEFELLNSIPSIYDFEFEKPLIFEEVKNGFRFGNDSVPMFEIPCCYFKYKSDVINKIPNKKNNIINFFYSDNESNTTKKVGEVKCKYVGDIYPPIQTQKCVYSDGTEKEFTISEKEFVDNFRKYFDKDLMMMLQIGTTIR